MNTGGLNWPWTLTHVQSKDMTAHLTAGIRHSPGRTALCREDCSLPGSLCVRLVTAVCVSGETEARFLEGDP